MPSTRELYLLRKDYLSKEDYLEQLRVDHILYDEEPPQDPCAICLDPLRGPVKTTCGHTFCYECLTKWFEGETTSCPHCRTVLFNARVGVRSEVTVDGIRDLDLPFDFDRDTVDFRLQQILDGHEFPAFSLEENALIDLEYLLPRAVAIIEAQIPEPVTYPREDGDETAKEDWTMLADSIHSVLTRHNGEEMLGALLWGSFLGEWCWRLPRCNQRWCLPEYSEEVEQEWGGQCFKDGLFNVFDYVMRAAQFRYAERNRVYT